MPCGTSTPGLSTLSSTRGLTNLRYEKPHLKAGFTLRCFQRLLACYPQGSFYPLSDGPSTRHHRITKPDFRPCSTCWSRSQAPFCLYTLRAISVRAEGTFGRLRYSFGGDRPSQTARLRMSARSLRLALESQSQKGGIPTSTP